MLLKVIEYELDCSEDNGAAEGSDITVPAWVLGKCMRSLQKRPQSEWTRQVDLGNWVKVGLKKFPTSPEVMEGLVELARAR
jgi:hypothetical protein